MTTWIKFEDRKPDESGWYIGCHHDKARGVIVEPLWWWDAQEQFDGGREANVTPTHWMPLPEPPSE